MQDKNLKKLPLDTADFVHIIENDMLYIDKTAYILNFMKYGSNFFLARPRRFGKTLLVDTLRQMYSGRKDLFQNTALFDSDWSWDVRPVIHIDMSSIACSAPDFLEKNLALTVEKIANDFNVCIDVDYQAPGGMLRSLVLELAKTKKPVVLIDEYDYFLIKNITDVDSAKRYRDILKDFYITLKNSEKYLEFVFITGVSKFSHMNLFSGLNHLIDLTMNDECAALLGYTEAELEKYFLSYIDSVAEKRGLPASEARLKMKNFYNGYRFSESRETVYNPFSLHRFFTWKKFENYWFGSGSPTFLFELMKKNNYRVNELEKAQVFSVTFATFDIEQISLSILLFQTGYLTISAYDPNKNFYLFDFPNLEVKESFYAYFVNYLVHDDLASAKVKSFSYQMIEALNKDDLQMIFSNFYDLLLSLNYDMHIPVEKYYQALFFVIFKTLGFDIKTEVKTNLGRIDVLIETKSSVFIIEFKIDKSAQEAIAQIIANKYQEPFLNSGKNIFLIGANFNSKIRNIEKDSWICQKV